jgi:hypothetical protein
LAYKIHKFLLNGNCPDDWFVVHPDQADSSALCDELQRWLDHEPAIIRVPKNCIEDAQKAGNDWTRILQQEPGDWVDILQKQDGKSGMILDVFNASGSTAKTLRALIRKRDLQVFGYFALVDFDPLGGDTIDDIPKYCLYRWCNPRQMSAHQ